ncbi:MAG TPA: hypothetical protein VGD67_22840 [Pseudonocardiaceae bacterium]
MADSRNVHTQDGCVNRTAPTPAERTLGARLAAHTSWARTPNRAARTANARAALAARFEAEVDPDGTLPAAERAQRAESARRAFMARLALKSAQARRAKRDALAATQVEAELDAIADAIANTDGGAA